MWHIGYRVIVHQHHRNVCHSDRQVSYESLHVRHPRRLGYLACLADAVSASSMRPSHSAPEPYTFDRSVVARLLGACDYNREFTPGTGGTAVVAGAYLDLVFLALVESGDGVVR